MSYSYSYSYSYPQVETAVGEEYDGAQEWYAADDSQMYTADGSQMFTAADIYSCVAPARGPCPPLGPLPRSALPPACAISAAARLSHHPWALPFARSPPSFGTTSTGC